MKLWMMKLSLLATCPLTAAQTADTEPLILKRTEIRDRAVGGMVSHTLLVPQGWRWHGGVAWTPGRGDNFVHFVGTLASPHGSEVSFGHNHAFAYNSNPQMLARFGTRMGGSLAGTPLRYGPRRPGEAGVLYVLPSLRPRATDVRVLEAETCPDGERHLAELMRPALEAQAQRNRMAGGSLRMDTWFHVERLRVTYTEAGQAYEEDLHYSCFGTDNAFASGFSTTHIGSWFVNDVRSVRAPRGRLAAELPTLVSLSRSLRTTPRWSTALLKTRLAITNQRAADARRAQEQLMATAQMVYRAQREASDRQMADWRKDNAIYDRIHQAQSNTVRGVSDYRTSTGEVVALDSSYEHIYGTGGDTFILTNDHLYDPNTDSRINNLDWNQLQRVDYFR